MADEKGAEPKKGGFFSRKKEEPKPATPPTAAGGPKPALPPGAKQPVPAQGPVKPGPAPVRPPSGAAPQKPVTAKPLIFEDSMFSFDTVPEIEKRIDRMEIHRYDSLMKRYESKFGEKLEPPTVFVSLDGEKQGDATAPEDPAKKAAMDAKIAAVTGVGAKPAPGASLKPGVAPEGPATPPAKQGWFSSKPATAPAPVQARPVVTPVRPPPGTMPPRPQAAPVQLAPVAPAKPSPINGKTFWRYLWCYWRMPFRKLVKLGDNPTGGKMAGATIADLIVWVLLVIPRIVLCPIGVIGESMAKKKAQNGAKAVSIASD